VLIISQTQLQIITAVVKLFLKKPDESQGLVQKVLQAATAESDNPDIRDRAYVYWRLLSSDPQIAKNVVLSARPPITSTIPVLPAPLLDSLLPHLSTLASVYHKPPTAFLGQGRASALQAAAIEEARQDARENPIAAAAVSAAVAGVNSSGAPQNAENLLDFDFDGAAPASMQKEPSMGSSGLEGLAGTPQSPGMTSPIAPSGGMDDLMGMFGNTPGPANGAVGDADLMNGFSGMDMNGGQPPAPQAQLEAAGDKRKTNEDLLGLF
jgi:AP-1 complex subunit beta-1